MNENDGRAGGISRPDIEHIERRAGFLDRLSLSGQTMLKDHDAGLRSQRQHHERGNENYRYHAGNPEVSSHVTDTRRAAAGFRRAAQPEFSTAPYRRTFALHTTVIGAFL